MHKVLHPSSIENFSRQSFFFWGVQRNLNHMVISLWTIGGWYKVVQYGSFSFISEEPVVEGGGIITNTQAVVWKLAPFRFISLSNLTEEFRLELLCVFVVLCSSKQITFSIPKSHYILASRQMCFCLTRVVSSLSYHLMLNLLSTCHNVPTIPTCIKNCLLLCKSYLKAWKN